LDCRQVNYYRPNMNKKLLTITLVSFLICILCNSQCLEGKYQDSTGSYISFLPDQRVEFLLLLRSGPEDIFKAGYGTYKIKHKRLQINIIHNYYGGTGSQVEFTPYNDSAKVGYFNFFVISKRDSTPISEVDIRYYTENNNQVTVITDSNGRAESRLLLMPYDSIIEVIPLRARQPAWILLNDLRGGSYTIRLADGNFEHVGFKEVVLPYVCYKDFFIVKYRNSDDIFALKKVKQ
jgi:hypothetical protein